MVLVFAVFIFIGLIVVQNFQEVTKKKYGKNAEKDFLVLDQVLQMQPFREHPIDIAHLGTLFVLDKVKILATN